MDNMNDIWAVETKGGIIKDEKSNDSLWKPSARLFSTYKNWKTRTEATLFKHGHRGTMQGWPQTKWNTRVESAQGFSYMKSLLFI